MKFRYLNHRGASEDRDVEVVALEALYNPQFGYEPGWFITARDPSRGGLERIFALDFKRMVPTPEQLDTMEAMNRTAVTYPIVEAERVGQVKAAVDGLVAHASKQTSPEVSKLAGKYINFGWEDLAIMDAPSREKLCKDIRTIAASALSQDEQK